MIPILLMTIHKLLIIISLGVHAFSNKNRHSLLDFFIAASIVPPLDLTCLPVTEQSPECSDLGISGLNKPSHALDERHINTRCKLALSLHDKKTDALKQRYVYVCLKWIYIDNKFKHYAKWQDENTKLRLSNTRTYKRRKFKHSLQRTNMNIVR